MITITPFEEFYTQDVIDLVLHFQNDGTRPIVTVEDQPDLLHITDAYFRIGGSFWIARDGEKLAGTIGIMPCGNGVAVLKKFEFFWFVRYGFFAEWMRGRRIGVTPGVWGVWYALLLGGLLLAAIHQRKERKEL